MSEELRLTLDEFKDQLVKELNYQLNGGTEYRQLTALYSFKIALEVKDINAFLTQENAKRLVHRHMGSLDKDRLNDVSKMLRVIAGRMLYEKTIPEGLKAHREKKSNSRLKLVYS